MNNRLDIYDIRNYTDNELFYNILDLNNNHSDRELEAKIVILINKYSNMSYESGHKLVEFYKNIYSHFFDVNFDDEQESESE